jgi:MFS family permease
VRWYESIGREQWKALAAAQLGWMLDATDVMLYAFALTSIQAEFGLSSGTAGLLMTATLISSSAGGILSG